MVEPAPTLMVVDRSENQELARERALSGLAVAALDGDDLPGVRRVALGVVDRYLGGSHITADGQRIVAGRVFDADDEEFAARVISVLAQARRLDELRHAANHDSLTGLPNRQLFHRVARLAGSTTEPTAVLVCDLDGLKAVNDRCGHLVGDGVLVVVARRITEACREHDLVTRTGGDEFVVLCPGATSEEAMQVAGRITESVTAPMVVDGTTVRITMSVGVAIGPPRAPLMAAIERADAAMYRTKQRRGSGSSARAARHVADRASLMAPLLFPISGLG